MKTIVTVLFLCMSPSVFAQANKPLTPGAAPVVKSPAAEPVVPEAASSFAKRLIDPANLSISAYGLYAVDKDAAGSGLSLNVHANQFLTAGLRFDWVNWESKQDDLLRPAMYGEIGLPLRLSKDVSLKPFAMAAVAMPLAGGGDLNDTAQGLFGAGARLSFKHLSLDASVEKWTQMEGLFIKAGASWKF